MDIIEKVAGKIAKWSILFMLFCFVIGIGWGMISRVGGPWKFFSYFGKFGLGLGDELVQQTGYFDFNMRSPYRDAQDVFSGSMDGFNVARCLEDDAIKYMQDALKKCKTSECRTTMTKRIGSCKRYLQKEAERYNEEKIKEAQEDEEEASKEKKTKKTTEKPNDKPKDKSNETKSERGDTDKENPRNTKDTPKQLSDGTN